MGKANRKRSSIPMWRALLCTVCCLGGASACSDDEIILRASLAAADGSSLTDAMHGFEGLRIALQQGDRNPRVYNYQLDGAGLVLRYPVSRNQSLRFAVEVFGEQKQWKGSSPHFFPWQAVHEVKVLVAELQSCHDIESLNVLVPRQGAAFAQVGSTGLVVGGEGSDREGLIELIDLLALRRWESNFELDTVLGAAKAFAVDGRTALIVSEHAEPFLYDVGLFAMIEVTDDLLEESDFDLDAIDLVGDPQVIHIDPSITLELLGNLGGQASTGFRVCIHAEPSLFAPSPPPQE